MKYEINPLKQIREYVQVVKPLNLLQNYLKLNYEKYREPKTKYKWEPLKGSYDGPLK